MAKLTTFENGLRLITIENKNVHSVSTGVFVSAGSCYENEKNNGISHFIEHNLFKGTSKRTSFEISDCIDRVGGQMNAYTSKEMTCYYTKTTKEHLALSLDLLSDILFNSKFDKTEMDKERGVILEEISMVEDTPDDVCFDNLSHAFFGEHPLGQTILGLPQNIKSIDVTDVKEYMNINYSPNNIIISVCGNFVQENVEELVKQNFVDGREGKKTVLPQIERHNTTSNFMFKEKQIEQCHLGFAIPSVSLNDDNLVVHQILTNIFGGGMTSRLFQNIREEKGLAYNIYSYNSTYMHNGSILIYGAVNPQSVELATSAIKEEINKLRKDKVTKEEFERGKAQTIGAYIFAEENPLTVMNLFGKNLLMKNEVYNFEERIKKMKEVSFNDVCDICQSAYSLENVSASLVGKNEVDILKIIKS